MNDWRDIAADQKPQILCLVAFLCPIFGLVTKPRIVSLEDAADYARYGFAVLVDPESESDLTRWLQWRRAFKR